MKNDYYVYLHKTLNGRTFYVGKGRNKRAWCTSSRSKSWKEIASLGYSVELYRQDLSEKDALELENNLITTLPDLVNKSTFTTIRFSDYAEYFKYDSDSPSGLTRIKGVFNGSYERGVIGYCGFKRTRSSGSQFWTVKFKNKSVQIHRIIWQLVYGEMFSVLVGFVPGIALFYSLTLNAG